MLMPQSGAAAQIPSRLSLPPAAAGRNSGLPQLPFPALA